MKTTQPLYQIFEIKHKQKFVELVNEYERAISNCREGFETKAHFTFLQEFAYPSYQKIQQDLGIYSQFLFEINDELENDKNKEYDNLFNERFSIIDKEKQKDVLDKLSLLQALNDFIKYTRAKEQEKSDTKSKIKDRQGNVFWKGKTELEFVHLIYALNEAGYLSNKKNEITTLVKEVAGLFNIDLGEHWQSNHSDNINNRNADYQPEIFDKLKHAYNKYREGLIAKKKKNRPK